MQRNITDFLKATDSMKIFSIMYINFCTLVTVYCICKIVKSAFRLVLYVTTFYMQHCAVTHFVLKLWFVCDYVCSWYEQFCMLLPLTTYYLFYMETSLIQTLHSVPSVSVLERFDSHCNGFDSKKSISRNLTYFLIFKATELK